jgi:hypothetical protein
MTLKQTIEHKAAQTMITTHKKYSYGVILKNLL